MTYEEVLYEVDDPVATITLNRPQALNAFTTRMGNELRHALGEAERDPRVVGIVLTGAGRGFCAGADMNMLSGISRATTSRPVQPTRRRARQRWATPAGATICAAPTRI